MLLGSCYENRVALLNNMSLRTLFLKHQLSEQKKVEYFDEKKFLENKKFFDVKKNLD